MPLLPPGNVQNSFPVGSYSAELDQSSPLVSSAMIVKNNSNNNFNNCKMPKQIYWAWLVLFKKRKIKTWEEKRIITIFYLFHMGCSRPLATFRRLVTAVNQVGFQSKMWINFWKSCPLTAYTFSVQNTWEFITPVLVAAVVLPIIVLFDGWYLTLGLRAGRRLASIPCMFEYKVGSDCEEVGEVCLWLGRVVLNFYR